MRLGDCTDITRIRNRRIRNARSTIPRRRLAARKWRRIARRGNAMSDATTTTGANAREVWVHLHDGRRMWMPWSEIVGIVAYRVDYVTHQSVRIDVEHQSGHVLGLDAGFAGFDAAMDTIVDRLPGARREWRAQLDAADDSDYVVVWRED
jgi:hypothetical protein